MTLVFTILYNLATALFLPVFLLASLAFLISGALLAVSGVATLLAVIFIVLKVVNVLDWSWLWVLSPLWLMAAGFLLMAISPTIIRHSAPHFGRVTADDPAIVWTERHLNWTLILGYIAAFMATEAVAKTLWLILHVSNVHEAFTEPIRFIVFWFAWWILITMLAVWYLRRKGRSSWHLLWWISLAVILGFVSVALGVIPLIGVVGVGVMLCLRNKKTASPLESFTEAGNNGLPF